MHSGTAELQEKQIQQAEELLFPGPEKVGFAKDLFFGRFRTPSMLPYPVLPPEAQRVGDEAVAAVRKFVDEKIDPEEIDRNSDIPSDVIQGLGELGVLGMTVSPEFGGKGFSQQNYCRVMEVIGSRCGSTTVFVNAHHSIGLRALELFGNSAQKEKWIRPLVTGEQLAAFALTETEAGSDAANVQTRAEPTADGDGYLLNGEKRYITNGAIAQVLTVMARTPASAEGGSDQNEGKITAFLVTPDMPGFEVVEARMPKVGIRGTATARLAFHDMLVPARNVLGPLGGGLRVALTVLDFGRTTFGASCTGAAKFCVARSIEHANGRRQFGRALSEFELVQQKIALAAADTFAMECATYQTAALIDSGAEDYMLETAMLKVFASEALWRIVNDTLQIHGGAGFFTDLPLERMMRDARLNMIGEGANDVLRCFIAMVGLRHLGKDMEEILRKPWKIGRLRRPIPQIPEIQRTDGLLGDHSRLHSTAVVLGRQIARFSRECRRALIQYRKEILDRQYVLARLADTATELFLSSCVYSRLYSIVDRTDTNEANRNRDLQTGLFYLKSAFRRNDERLASLHNNDDQEQARTADMWLNGRI